MPSSRPPLSRVAAIAASALAFGAVALASPDPLAAQDVPEVTLGKPTAELHSAIKSARSMLELRDGRLLIADGLAGKVRLADLATGTLEDRLSAGPEENDFRAIGLLWGWPGDSAAFVDAAKGRLTILTPDGRFARAIPLGEPPALGVDGPPGGPPTGPRGPRLPALRFLVSPDMAIGVGMSPRVAPPTGIAPPARVPYPLVRFRMETATYDTIIQLMPPQQPRTFVMNPTTSALSVFVGTESLQAVDVWAVLTDGTVAIVRAGSYRMDLIAPDGSRTQVGPIEAPRFAVTDGDRKRIVSGYKEVISAQMSSNPRMSRVRTVLYEEPTAWPVTHPPFRGDIAARVDRRDHIWLRTRCEKAEQATCYDVIARAGTRVRRVRLPENASLLGFGNNAVYLAMEEKGDKIVVQRYALPSP